VKRSYITAALVGFICGLGFLLLAGIVGCSAHQPIHAPTSHLAIPNDCIRNVHGTSKTRCVPIEGKPDLAVCDRVIVEFKCTKVVKEGE
jgi:hypothetical protein